MKKCETLKERMVKINKTRKVISRNSLIAFICISCLLLSFALANANTYYVAASDGSDSYNGLYPTRSGHSGSDGPWRTIQKAFNTAKGDDVINVRTGTYSGATCRINYGQGGSAGHWLTLQNYTGEIVTITSNIFIEANYVRVQGLHFNTTAGGTFSVGDGYGGGEHVDLLNCDFTGSATPVAVISSRGSYVLIEGNTVTNTGGARASTDHAIYIMAGQASDGDFTSNYNTVRNNTIVNASGWAIHLYDERKHDGEPDRYINYLLVEGNIIISPLLRGGIILGTGTATYIRHSTVRNNIIVNPATDGIGFGLSVDDTKVYNNTIYQSRGNAINVCWPATNIIVKNNIISNPGGYHVSNSGNSPSMTVDNNLYWPSPPSLKNTTDPAQVVGNPLFVNPSNNDFHLQPGSPAIDSGLTLTDMPTDKDGVTRPQDSGYDSGAYEYCTLGNCVYVDKSEPSPPTNLRIL